MKQFIVTVGLVFAIVLTGCQNVADVFKKADTAAINAFTIEVGGGSFTGQIDDQKGLIQVWVPEGTDLRYLVPEVSFTGRSLTPALGSEVDFSSPVMYQVEGWNGLFRDYLVTVSVGDGVPLLSAADPFYRQAFKEALSILFNATTKVASVSMPEFPVSSDPDHYELETGYPVSGTVDVDADDVGGIRIMRFQLSLADATLEDAFPGVGVSGHIEIKINDTFSPGPVPAQASPSRFFSLVGDLMLTQGTKTIAIGFDTLSLGGKVWIDGMAFRSVAEDFEIGGEPGPATDLMTAPLDVQQLGMAAMKLSFDSMGVAMNSLGSIELPVDHPALQEFPIAITTTNNVAYTDAFLIPLYDAAEMPSHPGAIKIRFSMTLAGAQDHLGTSSASGIVQMDGNGQSGEYHLWGELTFSGAIAGTATINDITYIGNGSGGTTSMRVTIAGTEYSWSSTQTTPGTYISEPAPNGGFETDSVWHTGATGGTDFTFAYDTSTFAEGMASGLLTVNNNGYAHIHNDMDLIPITADGPHRVSVKFKVVGSASYAYVGVWKGPELSTPGGQTFVSSTQFHPDESGFMVFELTDVPLNVGDFIRLEIGVQNSSGSPVQVWIDEVMLARPVQPET